MRLQRLTIGVCAVIALFAAATAQAQDVLAKAKNYYASAAYEEALTTLKSAHDLPSSKDLTEVAAYQMFCLLALGRNDEAKQATEMLVRIDPLYHPSESQVSPRVRTFFESTRRPLLPDIVRGAYSRAREAFDKKDIPTAQQQFDLAITLIDEIGNQDTSLGDLRTLVVGFRDLTKLAAAREAAAAAAAAPPAAKESEPSPAPPPPPTVFGPENTDVTRPVPISRTMPVWRPINALEQKLEFKGNLDLLIDEQGRVVSATLLKPIHPRYDQLLLSSARSWTFRPATRNGKPVRYLYRMAIQLGQQ